MPKYSIVTVVSNPDTYNLCLLQSLTKARVGYDIEIIPVINTNNCYSACDALNIGLDASKSDIVIFSHQDVSLIGDWFGRLNSIISNINGDWGVIGTAGISLNFTDSDVSKWGGPINKNKITVGQVWDSASNLNNEPYWDGIKETTKVHCVDECLFAINKSTGLRFDQLFSGFHFYGVDVCMQARAAMFPIYCGDLPIIHHGQYSSSMTGKNGYWHFLRLLYSKWHWQFPVLLGTHFHWSTSQRKNIHGDIEFIPNIISYISSELSSDDGLNVIIKSCGISEVKLKSDRQFGII